MKLPKKIALILTITLIFGNTFTSGTYANEKVNKNIETLIGKSRYETAIEISKKGWPQGTNEAVIVNDQSIVDAISATPFANLKNAPILLTQKDELNTNTKEQLKNLGVKKVYIIGGENAVSRNTENQLKLENITIDRIQGQSRENTSVEIAKRINAIKPISEVAVVNGYKGLADAVSIASVAGSKNMPILLAESKQSANAAYDFIKDKNIKCSYVIGGEAVVSDDIKKKLPNVKSIEGIDRNDTNAKVIETFFAENELKNIYVSKDGIKNDDQLVDALAVGVLAAKNNSPVLLVSSKLNETQKTIVDSKSFDVLTQVGGNGNENSFNEVKEIQKSVVYNVSTVEELKIAINKANANDVINMNSATRLISLNRAISQDINIETSKKITLNLSGTYEGKITVNTPNAKIVNKGTVKNIVVSSSNVTNNGVSIVNEGKITSLKISDNAKGKVLNNSGAIIQTLEISKNSSNVVIDNKGKVDTLKNNSSNSTVNNSGTITDDGSVGGSGSGGGAGGSSGGGTVGSGGVTDPEATKNQAKSDAQAAINSIPSEENINKDMIAEVEAKISTAKVKVEAYKALGGDEADLQNYDKIQKAEAKINELKNIAVSSVSITNKDVSVKKGSTLKFSVDVTANKDEYKSIIWSVTKADGSSVTDGTSISENGLLTVSENETATLLQIKATSAFDNTKSDIKGINVNKLTPILNQAPNIVDSITYGQVLSKITLNGSMKYNENNVPGTFKIENTNDAPNAINSLKVGWVFIPDNSNLYNEVHSTDEQKINISINKATPTTAGTVQAIANVSSGQEITALNGIEVKGVNGEIISGKWNGVAQNSSNTTQSILFTFTPDDITNYNTIEIYVDVTTLPLKISGAPTLGKTTITYGQKVEDTQLTTDGELTYGEDNSAKMINGKFKFENPTYVPNAGIRNVKWIFTPNTSVIDGETYEIATGEIQINVEKATPIKEGNAQDIRAIKPGKELNEFNSNPKIDELKDISIKGINNEILSGKWRGIAPQSDGQTTFTFTPDNKNYNVISVIANVVVKKDLPGLNNEVRIDVTDGVNKNGVADTVFEMLKEAGWKYNETKSTATTRQGYVKLEDKNGIDNIDGIVTIKATSSEDEDKDAMKLLGLMLGSKSTITYEELIQCVANGSNTIVDGNRNIKIEWDGSASHTIKVTFYNYPVNN